MDENRWFYLRHPEGFTPEHFGCVEAGFHIWAATVRANLEVWDKVPTHRDTPCPVYEFGVPHLSTDRTTATLPLGGDPAYVGMKLFEDQFPWEFSYFLPMWFRLDLEHGRKDTFGWFPEVAWHRFIAPDKADKLRNDWAYKRPDGAA